VSDSRHRRLAEVLVGYSTRVQPGDLVLVDAGAPAAPLLLEVYRSILRAGGHPLVRLTLDDVTEDLLRDGSDEQLDWVNPARLDDIETADVRIVLEAERNTKSLSGIEPARQARFARAREGLRHRYLERAAAGELRWVLTAFPTHAAAQDAEMSLAEYEEFVYRAGLLDEDDPIALWEEFARRLQGVAGFLSGVSELRVVADGTDLTLGVGGRTWVPAQGKENFPDGEVFTAPLETTVEGTISFTYPAVFQGREVQAVTLRFEGGEVVEAHAERGQEFLDEMVGLDDGARRAGEFAFGLNDGVTTFTRNILFDEKIGGTVHLALGAAYPETGGLNRSGLHWDMICDLRGGSEVYADGEVVYRDGRFLNGIWN
jgi:aminopeptidase